MKLLAALLFAMIASSPLVVGQVAKLDIPYGDSSIERQVLDIYAPTEAKKLPVVFWIHGGGWVTGDKASVQSKPQWFLQQGCVFVSTNYRLLPKVDMETIIRDVAKSLGWVHKNIESYGGDPNRIYVMGHSAGAQLAALICIDERYLQTEGVPFSVLQGCVPVDGDTFDIPAIIETAETRRRVHKQPQASFGHREKFGNSPEKHVLFSAVTHVTKGKKIPPFLIFHVSGHPDTSAQAQRLNSVLNESGVSSKLYGAKDSDHSKINNDIGVPNDSGTAMLLDFIKR
jgi:arylformamidase